MFIQAAVEASTDGELLMDGPHFAAHQRIRHFQFLPKPIQDAILQSGLLDQPGSFEWLYDTRVIRGLMLAHEAHNGKIRKLGGEARLIHEIWSAHKIYQISQHPWFKQRLKKEGLTPIDVVLGSVFHDVFENARSVALKTQGVFDEAALTLKVQDIVGVGAFRRWLKPLCLDYMTDADPTLKGVERIAAQKAKSYNKDGKLIITDAQQLWRIIDKLHHVSSDADYCIKQAKLLNDTNGTPEQWAELQALAQKCADKAASKSFVLDFPLAGVAKRLYKSSQKILQTTLSGDRAPSYAPVSTGFNLLKDTVAKRVQGLVHICGAAAKSGQKLLPPRGAFTTINL